jgi:hypothetical protein
MVNKSKIKGEKRERRKEVHPQISGFISPKGKSGLEILK